MSSSSHPPPDQLSYVQLHQRLSHGLALLFLASSFILLLTFASFAHPPSPLPSPDSVSLPVFYYLNGVAFFSSLSGVLVCVSQAVAAIALPNSVLLRSVEGEIAAQRRLLAADLPRMAYGVIFLTLAALSFAGAFLFAGLATQSNVRSLRLAVIIPCAVGGIVFMQALLVLLREMILVWRRICESDPQLWKALEKETLFGSVTARYLRLVAGNTFTEVQREEPAQEANAEQSKV